MLYSIVPPLVTLPLTTIITMGVNSLSDFLSNPNMIQSQFVCCDADDSPIQEGSKSIDTFDGNDKGINDSSY